MMTFHVKPATITHKVHNTLLHIALGFFALDLAGTMVPPVGRFLGDRAHFVVAIAAFFEVSAGHLEAFLPPPRRHRLTKQEEHEANA